MCTVMCSRWFGSNPSPQGPIFSRDTVPLSRKCQRPSPSLLRGFMKLLAVAGCPLGSLSQFLNDFKSYCSRAYVTRCSNNFLLLHKISGFWFTLKALYLHTYWSYKWHNDLTIEPNNQMCIHLKDSLRYFWNESFYFLIDVIRFTCPRTYEYVHCTVL